MYKTKVSSPIQGYKHSKNRLDILIVDDDDASCESLKDIIDIHGHNVTTIYEGMGCVNRCTETKYDIIFMDYHIENIGGDEIIDEVNGSVVTDLVKNGTDRDPHIYAYTGDNSYGVIKKCKENGMHGMFIKPVNPDLMREFLSIVETDINNTIKLKKLALKCKNFMYFEKK